MTTGALINFLGLTGCNWLLVRHFDLFNAFLQTKVLATTTLYLWARLPVSALYARHFGGKEIGQIYIFALLITVVVVTKQLFAEGKVNGI